jgi:hypothetical protein
MLIARNGVVIPLEAQGWNAVASDEEKDPQPGE